MRIPSAVYSAKLSRPVPPPSGQKRTSFSSQDKRMGSRNPCKTTGTIFFIFSMFKLSLHCKQWQNNTIPLIIKNYPPKKKEILKTNDLACALHLYIYSCFILSWQNYFLLPFLAESIIFPVASVTIFKSIIYICTMESHRNVSKIWMRCFRDFLVIFSRNNYILRKGWLHILKTFDSIFVHMYNTFR
jgi:hypothetical protein